MQTKAESNSNIKSRVKVRESVALSLFRTDFHLVGVQALFTNGESRQIISIVGQRF